MKKQSDMTSLTPKAEITVFQALTLLLEKYRDTPDIYEKIESIYLTGVRSQRAEWMLSNLLEDPLLDAYIINTSKQAINDDPVRRYFESHLCHNTLATSLDELDMDLLEKHFKSIFNLIDEDDHSFIEPIIDGRASPSDKNEYSDGLAKLKKLSSYQSLQPKEASGRATPENRLNNRKQKLILIAKCMYAARKVPEEMSSGETPLDIYCRPNSPYHDNNRGRTPRFDMERREDDHTSGVYQTTCPQTLGIMRSFMPLPAEDALLEEKPSTSPRHADTFTYAKGSYCIPDQMFSNKVTPFVSSISGTMLIKLRVMAQLLRENQFVFDGSNTSYREKNKQLELFLKTFIAYMIYYAGGHSLDEYLQVLNQDVVQHEFKHLKGFEDLTLMNLFQKGNVEAFNKTVEQTIAYNNNILLKKKLHLNLETQHTVKLIVDNSNRTHPATVGTIRFNRPGTDASYTVMDSSIIGGALLFALIRLLDNKSVPANRQNDLSQRFKQLCFVLCMATVAQTFGAKIMKQEKIQQHPHDPKNTQTNISTLISSATKKVLDYSLFKAPEKLKPKTIELAITTRHARSKTT
jgi:hypothetical protein